MPESYRRSHCRRAWIVQRLALIPLAAWLIGCEQPIPYDIEPPPRRPVAPVVRRVVRPAPVLAAYPPPLPPRPPQDGRCVLLGYSVQGRPLTMQVFGQGAHGTFILAGIHGNEGCGVKLVNELAEYLRSHPEAYRGTTVALLPAANPDGLALNKRANARGVDLNRNFPARNWSPSRGGQYAGGGRPASEPETTAIMGAIDLIRPDRIVSVHAIDRGRHCNNYDGPAAELARLMNSRNGYPVKAAIGYPTPGSMGSWAGVDHQVPMVTLELPYDSVGESCWTQNGQALLAVISVAAQDALAGK